MPQVGLEPTAFEILSLDGLPIAYRGIVCGYQFGEKDSNLHRLVQSQEAYR